MLSISSKVDDLGWPWTAIRLNFLGISRDFTDLRGNNGKTNDDRPALSAMYRLRLGTQEIRFGRKTNEIAKFSILDKKWNSQVWTKFGQKWPTDRRKNCQILSQSLANYHRAFTVALKLVRINGCIELSGCEWINFLSQNERVHRTAGTTSWHQSFGAYRSNQSIKDHK